MASMIICSKGASPSVKSLMRDLSFMIPNVNESKYDIKKQINVLGSLMEMNECRNALFFECTKRVERLWVVNKNCSMRFKINNLESIYDLSTLTNYHKNGGHVLLFTDDFDDKNSIKIKNLFQEAFAPYENASIERCLCFYQANGQVYIRNYFIESGEEIGPRINMELDLILDGCFKGKTLYRKTEENTENTADDENADADKTIETENNINID